MPFGKGLDVIQQALSGTGKTATFCTGILQNMDYNLLECQALVLAPTRELAQQIETVMRALGDFQQVQTSLNFLPTRRAGLQGAQLAALQPAPWRPDSQLLDTGLLTARLCDKQTDGKLL